MVTIRQETEESSFHRGWLCSTLFQIHTPEYFEANCKLCKLYMISIYFDFILSQKMKS